MYTVIRIVEGGGYPASEAMEAARARVDVMGRAAGFVTLLAVLGEDGALVTVEIFETLDDLAAAQGGTAPGSGQAPAQGGLETARTITGEIVFQRGL